MSEFIMIGLAVLVGVLVIMLLNSRIKQAELTQNVTKINDAYQESILKNKDLVSKKVSADVRLGAIAENLMPMLNGLPYDSKNLHHLAQPVDYIYFSYNEQDPHITLVEVKSGNARESKRQNQIKKIIKEGRIHYDLVQINDQGVKVTRKV